MKRMIRADVTTDNIPYGLAYVKQMILDNNHEGWNLDEIEMDYGDAQQLADWMTRKGYDVTTYPETSSHEVLWACDQLHCNWCDGVFCTSEYIPDDEDEQQSYIGSSIRASASWYFGKEEYEKYHGLVQEKLRGVTISKRVIDGDNPGGIKYEAEKLGIDLYDLLSCLEGMCYNGEAREIDDSHYTVL